MNTDHAPSKPSQGALRVALLYAVFAGLWILLSDWAMGLLFRDPESLVWASTAKGWFFVAVTTLVLYVLVARLVGQLNASHQRERAEAEEKWRATQLLAAIVKSSDDAIFAKDDQGRYLLVNNAAARYMGKSAEDLLGHDDRVAFPDEQAALLMAIDRRVFASGQVETNEERLNTAEGERVLATAQRMLHEHQVLQQDLSSDAAHPRGTLRLGAVPTAMPILARFAAQLQARHPGIVPVVLSMSSQALEAGLENIALDLALGYTERMPVRGGTLRAWPQYVEHYFLLRRAPRPPKGAARGLQIGPPMAWADAAALPLCLLTPEMHNRSLVDGAFRSAGATVLPAMETDSVLTLALSVVAGQVCSVLPGALDGCSGIVHSRSAW